MPEPGEFMRNSTYKILEDLLNRHESLRSIQKELNEALVILIQTFKKEKKLFVCGNGGSAADSAHIAGELMKSFNISRNLNKNACPAIENLKDSEILKRKLEYGLPCIDLTSNLSLQTAILNDIGAEFIFAQQLFVYGSSGDVLLAISTSGNSQNVCLAARVAKLKGMKTIGLQGINRHSNLAQLADVIISVPEKETYLIQEKHLPIYHALCLALENEFFGEE